MAIVTMTSMVARMIPIGPSPTVARVGVAGAVILAVCIRIELGAPARIVNDVLRRGRSGKYGQQGDNTEQDR